MDLATSSLPLVRRQTRVWYRGCASAFQADEVGPSPTTRSRFNADRPSSDRFEAPSAPRGGGYRSVAQLGRALASDARGFAGSSPVTPTNMSSKEGRSVLVTIRGYPRRKRRIPEACGCSSVVEHLFAKQKVEVSITFTRSNFPSS